MIKQVPNDIFIPNVITFLNEGMEVTLLAKGRSMSPYIKDGKDELILQGVDIQTLAVGDIVLAKTVAGLYVIHRIIEVAGDDIILMGDGNLYGTETCRRKDVFGKLMYIGREGRRIDCNTPSERRKALFLRAVNRFFRKIYHKFAGIVKMIVRP